MPGTKFDAPRSLVSPNLVPVTFPRTHGEASGIGIHVYYPWPPKTPPSRPVNGRTTRQIDTNETRPRFPPFPETSDAFDYVAGEAADAYPEGLVDQFTRHILFAKPDVVIILAELRAPEPQTFEWWLHSPEAMELNRQHDIRVSVGDAGAHVNMLVPEGLGLSQTDQFDPPPRERIQLTQWHLTAETSEPANAMRFVTIIRPHREGEQPPTFAETELRDDYYAVRAKVDDGELIAVWRLGPGEVTAMGLTTDGEVAAMRVSDDGEPGVYMVHEGTRVDFQGR